MFSFYTGEKEDCQLSERRQIIVEGIGDVVDCEQSLFFFRIVEGSARLICDCETASLAIANRALPSTIPKKNNDCSQSRDVGEHTGHVDVQFEHST